MLSSTTLDHAAERDHSAAMSRLEERRDLLFVHAAEA
jgi:hypothetical protein